MTTRILFVCLGNICRSPSAEGVFRDMARDAGLAAETDSAGTSGWHIGDPPYGPAVKAAARRGYDLSMLRARQLSRADFARFDHIVVMDRDNLTNTEALRPADSHTPVTLFLSHAQGDMPEEVPDPYYTRDFDGALDLIEAASRGLIAQLQKASAVSPKAR